MVFWQKKKRNCPHLRLGEVLFFAQDSGSLARRGATECLRTLRGTGELDATLFGGEGFGMFVDGLFLLLRVV